MSAANLNHAASRSKTTGSSYLNDIVVRDIKQVADIERAADMRRLITLLAARCGCTINMAKLRSA